MLNFSLKASKFRCLLVYMIAKFHNFRPRKAIFLLAAGQTDNLGPP